MMGTLRWEFSKDRADMSLSAVRERGYTKSDALTAYKEKIAVAQEFIVRKAFIEGDAEISAWVAGKISALDGAMFGAQEVTPVIKDDRIVAVEFGGWLGQRPFAVIRPDGPNFERVEFVGTRLSSIVNPDGTFHLDARNFFYGLVQFVEGLGERWLNK